MGNVGLADAGSISGRALYWFYAGQPGAVGDANQAERAAVHRRAFNRVPETRNQGHS